MRQQIRPLYRHIREKKDCKIIRIRNITKKIYINTNNYLNRYKLPRALTYFTEDHFYNY